MVLNNVRLIRAEDYQEEFRDTASRLASVLNPFMQDVKDLTDGRISFENTTQGFRQFQITVDASGKPVGTSQISLGTDATQVLGLSVIRVRNLTNPNIFPTSQPFISYTTVNQQLIQIQAISGLPAGRYELNIVTY